MQEPRATKPAGMNGDASHLWDYMFKLDSKLDTMRGRIDKMLYVGVGILTSVIGVLVATIFVLLSRPMP